MCVTPLETGRNVSDNNPIFSERVCAAREGKDAAGTEDDCNRVLVVEAGADAEVLSPLLRRGTGIDQDAYVSSRIPLALDF